MTTTAQLVEAFFGRDPLRGEDAYIELLREQGAGAIDTLIPLQGIPDSRSAQISARLPRDPGAGCSSSRSPIPTRDCVRPGGFPRHPDERLDRTG